MESHLWFPQKLKMLVYEFWDKVTLTDDIFRRHTTSRWKIILILQLKLKELDIYLNGLESVK